MYKKLLLSIAFVAIIGIDVANSLGCYSCSDPVQCSGRNQRYYQCNKESADNTLNLLKNYVKGLKPVYYTSEYYCANFTITEQYTRRTVVAIAGCVHASIKTCDSTLIKENAPNGAYVKDCAECNMERCPHRPKYVLAQTQPPVVMRPVVTQQVVSYQPPVQLLSCLACTTPTECRQPKNVTCNDKEALSTVALFSKYLNNIPSYARTPYYKCGGIHYWNAKNKKNIISVYGCLHQEVNVALRAGAQTLRAESVPKGTYIGEFQSCVGNACLRPSSASKFDSSFYTLFVTIIMFGLIKVLA